MSRAYRWLDNTMPVWAKIVLVSLISGLMSMILAAAGIWFIREHVPPENRAMFMMAIIGLLIWFKLDSIERRLK